MTNTPGHLFRQFASGKGMPLVGAPNAFCAKMAEKIGFKALYLSGSVTAALSYGLPDLGMTSLNDVLEEARRLVGVTALPLLVDIDTGWGGAFNIARTIKEMHKAGVAAVHIEDQVAEKRCGHRPNKTIVSTEEMVNRIKAAVDAKSDSDFVVMARTDAFANEGLQGLFDRVGAYVEAGADMIFPEALMALSDYQALSENISVPFLANITEFGKTPLFSQAELAQVGVSMVLYPCSASRAMNKAAEDVYQTILHNGSQQDCVDRMLTRESLYDYLDYYDFENKLDSLYGK